MRLYIIHEYTPRNCSLHDAARIANTNVLSSISFQQYFMELGHFVYNPLVSHFIHVNMTKPFSHDYWLDFDMTVLDHWAQAVVLCGDCNSDGCTIDLQRAQTNRLAIYRKPSEVPSVGSGLR